MKATTEMVFPSVVPFGPNRQTALQVVAVELNTALAANLDRSGLAGVVRCSDFLACSAEQLGGLFDRVVMNPPFGAGADIQHITHALAMLKPGGRLVALCANGPRQNASLRPLVEACGGDWEDLPADSFKAEGVGAGMKVLQISRFENAHGSSRRATDAWFDVGQGFTSLSPLVAGIAARTAPAAEEIPAELDQEPRGGRQVIL